MAAVVGYIVEFVVLLELVLMEDFVVSGNVLAFAEMLLVSVVTSFVAAPGFVVLPVGVGLGVVAALLSLCLAVVSLVMLLAVVTRFSVCVMTFRAVPFASLLTVSCMMFLAVVAAASFLMVMCVLVGVI